MRLAHWTRGLIRGPGCNQSNEIEKKKRNFEMLDKVREMQTGKFIYHMAAMTWRAGGTRIESARNK